MENSKSSQEKETNKDSVEKPERNESQTKPKSPGNKNFRKHNELGFYRFMQRKKKKKPKPVN